MRWFWMFILGLVLATGGLYALRVRTPKDVVPITMPKSAKKSIPLETTHDAAPTLVLEEPVEEPVAELIAELVTEQIADPIVVSEPVADEGVSKEGIKPALIVELMPEQVSEPEPALVEEVVDEAEGIIETETEAVVEPIEEIVVEEPSAVVVEEEIVIQVEAKPTPTFEQLADGSLKVFATDTVIAGSGTRADPFVLDWVTLRAIERVFNPKKGKDELPAWLDVLHEKHVRIKGNTLVPVIATTTQELLVMQNPWDGCCIGIPPSPYDAIEVELDHDVDFGSSAVGYGTVEGVFVLDPYVVDGWVLGLYMIEEASYRSGDGIAFPDF